MTNVLKEQPVLGVKPLKPSGYNMYHQVYYSQILQSAHTVYIYIYECVCVCVCLCFLWLSEQTAIISLHNIN